MAEIVVNNLKVDQMGLGNRSITRRCLTEKVRPVLDSASKTGLDKNIVVAITWVFLKTQKTKGQNRGSAPY